MDARTRALAPRGWSVRMSVRPSRLEACRRAAAYFEVAHHLTLAIEQAADGVALGVRLAVVLKLVVVRLFAGTAEAKAERQSLKPVLYR